MTTQTQGKWKEKNSLSEIKTQHSIRDDPLSQSQVFENTSKVNISLLRLIERPRRHKSEKGHLEWKGAKIKGAKTLKNNSNLSDLKPF